MTDKLQWLSTTSLPAQADPENPFYSPTKKSYVDYFPIPTRPDLDVSNIDEAVSILLFDLAWVFVLNTAALAGTQTMESYFYPHEVIQQKLKGQSLELWGAIHSEQVNITCGPSEIGDPANQSQGFSLFDYMDAVKKDYENTNPYQSAITAEMQMRYLTRCLISLLEMTAPDTLRTCLKKCDQYPACTKVAISCMRTAKEAVIIDECSIVEAMQPGKYSIMAGPERDKEKYSEFLKSFLEETPYRIENYRELNDPQHLGFYHSIFKVTLFKIETNGLEQIELATNNGRILSPINDLLEIIRLETQSLNFFLETALEHIGNDQIDTKTELVNEATIADCHTSPDEPQPKETSPNKTTKKKSKKQPPKQPENPTPAETNLSVIIHPLFITTMVFFFYMPLNMSAPLIVMALVCIAAAVIVVKKKCRNCGILRSCTTTVALFALTSITATTAIRIAQLLYEIHYYGNPLSPTTDNLSPLDYLATTPLPSTEILLPAMLVSVGIGSHLLAKHMPKQNPIDKGAKWRPYLYGLIIYLTWIAVCVIPFGMAPFFILLGIASAIGGLISLDLFSSIIDCCVGLIFGGFFIMCSMCLIEPKGPRLKRWSNCVLRAPWLILKELGAPVESPLTSETTPQGD